MSDYIKHKCSRVRLLIRYNLGVFSDLADHFKEDQELGQELRKLIDKERHG